jgi:hypothetical protein
MMDYTALKDARYCPICGKVLKITGTAEFNAHEFDIEAKQIRFTSYCNAKDIVLSGFCSKHGSFTAVADYSEADSNLLTFVKWQRPCTI